MSGKNIIPFMIVIALMLVSCSLSSVLSPSASPTLQSVNLSTQAAETVAAVLNLYSSPKQYSIAHCTSGSI